MFEDLSAKQHLFKILPLDEPTFDIDVNTRDIKVPEVFRKNGVGVQGDQLAEIIYFTVDRYFEHTDLYRDDIQVIIQWESAAKGKQVEVGYSPAVFKDVTIVKNKMVFGWLVNNTITSNPGTVKFSVRFFSTTQKNDDNNNAILALNFSLSTKTQTVTINPGLTYAISDESGLPEVNLYDDLSLVTNRFKDSVYIGEADSAEDPVFLREHGGILIDDTDCWGHIPADPEVEGDKMRHLVDLVNGTLELSTEAKSTDAGKISYFWYKRALDGVNDDKVDSTPVYVATGDMMFDGTKDYYIKQTAAGVDTYVKATIVEGDLIPDSPTFYEQFNGIIVNSTGDYWVVAKNRHGVASAEVKSDIVRVPGPAELVVEAPLASDWLTEEGKAKLSAVGATEQLNDVIHYNWGDWTSKELLQGKYYNNLGIGKNSGDSYELPIVPEEDRPYFDQTIELSMYAERNGDKTETQTFQSRVTDMPHAPAITTSHTGVVYTALQGGTIGVEVSLKVYAADKDIVSDEISYQWYKFTSSEDDNDFLLVDENGPTLDYEIGANGSYYCKVTNHVNGQEKTVDSARITLLNE